MELSSADLAAITSVGRTSPSAMAAYATFLKTSNCESCNNWRIAATADLWTIIEAQHYPQDGRDRQALHKTIVYSGSDIAGTDSSAGIAALEPRRVFGADSAGASGALGAGFTWTTKFPTKGVLPSGSLRPVS